MAAVGSAAWVHGGEGAHVQSRVEQCAAETRRPKQERFCTHPNHGHRERNTFSQGQHTGYSEPEGPAEGIACRDRNRLTPGRRACAESGGTVRC